MASASAANATPHTACVINDRIFYGSDNQLLCWQVEDTINARALADLDGHIEALCRCGEYELSVGTDTGSVYVVNTVSTACDIIDKLCRPITCVASNREFPEDLQERLYAYGSMDGFAYIYNPITKEKQTKKMRGYALCAEFCEDLLVVGGTFNKLMVIHSKTDEESWLEGHEAWVRALAFHKTSSTSYTLASASQERYIRLWDFRKTNQPRSGTDEDLSSNVKVIEDWNITFEALSMGHDDWVIDVTWDPAGSGTSLSASSDSSLIIWMSENSDLWTPDYRLGDVSTWGASTATGTSGGFWAALWLYKQNNGGKAASTVATVTKTGSLRVWQESSDSHWQSLPAPTGHFRETTDIAWFRKDFLLSTSLDQTTRLWYTSAHKNRPSLSEIGRPQIHGYDMVAIAPIDGHTFVSAGDEKVMRIFELPRQVAEQMAKVSHTSVSGTSKTEDLPLVAGVPALGSSNKPEIAEDVSETLPERPQENHLQRLTLWPEVDKLYGHGFEISCLAVSQTLNTIISCSKANTEQHARLKFFSTSNYHEITKSSRGPAHTLTVTRLAISPDGSKVLSVSRDRKFMITDINTQEVEIDVPKAHTRIIWDAAWFNDGVTFITGSRDKQVKKWRLNTSEVEVLVSCKFESSVTAVAACDRFVAVGEESGKITVWNTDLDKKISEFKTPHRVARLVFNDDGNRLAAASGHTIQIQSVSQ